MPIVTVSCKTCGLHMPMSKAMFSDSNEDYYCPFHGAEIEIGYLEEIIKIREEHIERANNDIAEFKKQIVRLRKIQEDKPLSSTTETPS